LHVLSTPPAFVLSQDQTLQKRIQNPADNIPTGVGTINQIKHLASTIQYDTLLSSQETVTRLVFPCGFPCGVPNSIRFSGAYFPLPGPPSSFGTVCRLADQRPVVATRRTLGNRAGRVKSRFQAPEAPLSDPHTRPRAPTRREPHSPSSAGRAFTGGFTTDSLSRRPSCILATHHIAGWSSSVARWAHNPEVAGSNPVPAT
jgi:hypothetical protein